MARFLCLGVLYWEVKIEGLVHWKVYHVENKEYALRGPTAKLENANPFDKKVWHPR